MSDSDKARFALVSIDGLSQADLSDLLALIPRFASEFDFKEVNLNSAPLTSSQGIWAELLTGKSWEENGCVGYSKPVGSLNDIKIFSERHLLAPLNIAKDSSENPPIYINVPLTLPGDNKRIWLSPGALPIHTLVSPTQLLDNDLFQRYRPRAAENYHDATSSIRKFVTSCSEIENNRLECLRKLIDSQQHSSIVFRISILEHLQHVLGLGLGAARESRAWKAVSEYFQRLDNELLHLCRVFKKRVMLISPYSHSKCINVINLNAALMEANFLRLNSDPLGGARKLRHRPEATSSLRELYSSTAMFDNFEGRLIIKETVAASPVGGCIFINRSSDFRDGIISESEEPDVRQRLRRFLDETFVRRYGKDCEIAESSVVGKSVPAFVVNIKGVEFTDVIRSPRDVDVPLVTHAPYGFALFPSAEKISTGPISAAGLNHLLRN